jgi:hypothetical protein
VAGFVGRRLDIHNVMDDMCERYLGRTLTSEVDCAWEYFPSAGYWNHALAGVFINGDDSIDLRLDRHLLEADWIPLYFLRNLVWHEAVHIFRYEESDDIDAGHSSAFQLAMCLYPGRLRAEAWHTANEDRLCRYLDRVRVASDVRSLRLSDAPGYRK